MLICIGVMFLFALNTVHLTMYIKGFCFAYANCDSSQENSAVVIFKITAAFLFASVKSGGVITIDEDSRMLLKQEAEFARKHKQDTDEELIEYMKCCAEKLKSCPKKNDAIGHTYLKQRLGPWPRIW